MKKRAVKRGHFLLLICWIVLLAFFFAKVEIQIEGCHGWASALPTWRIDRHPLLDIFWGGRPMTGYHAWVFSFMFLAFHLPQALCGRFSFRLEARSLGSLMLFWIVEDLFWFLMNPAYGPSRFAPAFIPWHKHWLLGVPTDYLRCSVFVVVVQRSRRIKMKDFFSLVLSVFILCIRGYEKLQRLLNGMRTDG